MLRRYLLILILTLLSLLSPMAVQADSRLAILTDIEATVKDFASSLNNLYEDDIIVSEELDRIADVFGSDEYFIFNGRTMDSFRGWLDLYYGQVMQSGYTEHTLHIKERTLEKVDPAEDDDKRYCIKCILERMTDNNQYIPQEVTFIVMWKGEDKYVSILEANGDWGLDIVGISKPGEKSWFYMLPEWLFALLYFSAVILFIYVTVFVYEKFRIEERVSPIVNKIIIVVIMTVPFLVLIPSIYKESTWEDKYEIHQRIDKYQIAWVKKDGKIGMIDYTGQLILDYQFDEVGSFRDGLAWVWFDNHGGFVNTYGEVVIPPIYTYVRTFKNGKTLVGNENGHFLINTKGEIIKDLNIQKLNNFFDGRAAFLWGDKWGYLDGNYTEVIPPVYTSAENFNDGRAIVQKDNYKGVIDANNNIVIPLKYFRINRVFNHFLVRKNNKFGLLDRNGKTLIPVKYDFIRIETDGKATVTLNGKKFNIGYDTNNRENTLIDGMKWN